MRKILVLLVLIGIVLVLMTPVSEKQTPIENQKQTVSTVPTVTTKREPGEVSKAIFVPDWNLSEESILHNGYDRWIYFGGKEKLSLFVNSLQDKNLWMTIKVDTIEELEDVNLQDYDLAKISGIVLDLEINGIATEKFKNQINKGVEKVYTNAKANSLQIALAVYGDLFYRKRPYDLETLNSFSDEVMVMAYDFHKSYGEPGENYPYEDFKKMVDEYSKVVPAEKLTIVFGMYGYDWTLKDGKPLKPAQSLSLYQIKSRFLKKICLEDNCEVKINENTKEKNVSYMGEDGYEHVVYFEDEESVDMKTEYLKQKGIESTAFWAWGNF